MIYKLHTHIHTHTHTYTQSHTVTHSHLRNRNLFRVFRASQISENRAEIALLTNIKIRIYIQILQYAYI